MRQHYIFGFFSWKSAVKFTIVLASLLTIIFGYWTALFNYKYTPFNSEVINFRSMQYWSFFSTQVNVIIFLFFLYIFLFYRSEGITIWTGFTMKIVISVYTTFVIVVYWTMIFPFDWLQRSYTIKDWYLIMFFQNGIIPLLSLGYLITTGTEEKHYFFRFMKKKLWIIFLYPICYLIFIIIGGELRLLDHYKNPELFVIKGQIDWIKIYNYRFISYHQKTSFINLDGIVTFVIFMLLFVILLIFLVWFYLVIFNLSFKKVKKKKQKV